ncbi:hypothetical protein V8C42DRAFT_211724 [Trichoderma barbatum]
MNWMGGNLSRHRRGKGWKEDMARQKEYFARARSRQREGVSSSPVPLSAANFIPNYTSPLETITSLAGTGVPSSTLISEPICAAGEVSESLRNPPRGLQMDVTELSFPVSPSQLDQSPEDHSIGASDLETGCQTRSRKSDSAGIQLPKISVREPIWKNAYTASFRYTSEQQRPLGTATGNRKMPSGFDRQEDIRKRKVRQAMPSPTPRSVRIRIGSQDYRWSEARNSIGDLTHGDLSAIQSTVSEETKNITLPSRLDNASYMTDMTFTRFSPSSSDLPLSSPCRDRASRRRELHNSTRQMGGAALAELQRPKLDCTCGAVTKPPSSTSDFESTDSIAVQVSDGVPEAEADEEQIWRQWLG